jgi:hypothetical protein
MAGRRGIDPFRQRGAPGRPVLRGAVPQRRCEQRRLRDVVGQQVAVLCRDHRHHGSGRGIARIKTALQQAALIVHDVRQLEQRAQRPGTGGVVTDADRPRPVRRRDMPSAELVRHGPEVEPADARGDRTVHDFDEIVAKHLVHRARVGRMTRAIEARRDPVESVPGVDARRVAQVGPYPCIGPGTIQADETVGDDRQRNRNRWRSVLTWDDLDTGDDRGGEQRKEQAHVHAAKVRPRAPLIDANRHDPLRAPGQTSVNRTGRRVGDESSR